MVAIPINSSADSVRSKKPRLNEEECVHPLTDTEPIVYVCDGCIFSTTERLSATMHLSEHRHPSCSAYRCVYCRGLLSSCPPTDHKQLVMQSARVVRNGSASFGTLPDWGTVGVVVVMCPECELIFPDKLVCAYHHQTQHTTYVPAFALGRVMCVRRCRVSRVLSCDQCRKDMPSIDELLKHWNNAERSGAPCRSPFSPVDHLSKGLMAATHIVNVYCDLCAQRVSHPVRPHQVPAAQWSQNLAFTCLKHASTHLIGQVSDCVLRIGLVQRHTSDLLSRFVLHPFSNRSVSALNLHFLEQAKLLVAYLKICCLDGDNSFLPSALSACDRLAARIYQDKSDELNPDKTLRADRLSEKEVSETCVLRVNTPTCEVGSVASPDTPTSSKSLSRSSTTVQQRPLESRNVWRMVWRTVPTGPTDEDGRFLTHTSLRGMASRLTCKRGLFVCDNCSFTTVQEEEAITHLTDQGHLSCSEYQIDPKSKWRTMQNPRVLHHDAPSTTKPGWTVGDNVVFCPTCYLIFPDKLLCALHFRAAHPNDSLQYALGLLLEARQFAVSPQVECPTCHVTFSRLKQLTFHWSLFDNSCLSPFLPAPSRTTSAEGSSPVRRQLVEVHCEFCHMCFSHVPTMSSKMKASRKLSNSAKLIELNRLQKNSTFGDGFDLLPTELLFKLFAWAHSFGNSVLKHLLGHVGEVKQCQVTVRLVDIDKMIVEQFTSPE